ncbi:MAG: PAS domain S-box protein, partial [Syntrophaceae bacterium]|nr:PAS domain S-box protein [Syntrophaceae bacterium]
MKGEKQTKEQLVNEPAEIRLADIVDFLPDPTFAVDLSGKVIVWNHAIEEMTGVKAEDMLGKGDHEYIVPFYGVPRPVLIDLALKHDEELEKKYDFVKREGDVLLAEAEVPVRGVPRILWGKARPLYDNNGDIIGAIESVRDITMLRQAKEVLQKAHDELENRVRERTVELTEMNDALQKEIFERERAEAVLKESEEKYNQFFKTSRDCVFITSNDGRIVDTNDAAMELLGYSSRDELLKMKVPDLYADPEERVKHLRIIAKQGYAKEFPVDMRRKDGSIRHTLVTSAARYDADGNPIGAQGTIRDITERKKSDEDLIRKKNQLQNLLNIYQHPDTQTKDIFSFVIEECIRMSASQIGFFGSINEDETLMVAHLWSEEAMKGCNMEFKPVEFPLDHAGIWAEAIRLHKPLIINDYSKADPRKKGYPEGHVAIKRLMSIPVIRKGKAIGITAVANKKQDYDESDLLELSLFSESMWDIFKHKQTEESLRQSEEKYRKIFEGATEGIYQTTPEGVYLSMNPAFARMAGYTSPQDMIDSVTDIGRQHYVNPKDREEMVRLLCENDNVEGYEVEVYRKDGSRFWISINCHTVRDAWGNILYFEGTNVDITARKNAEDALRESQDYTKILFNSSIIPQIVMDAETGLYIDCNEAAVKVYGYAGREEVLNKTPFDVSAPTQYNGLDSATEAQKRIQLCRENSSHVFEWRHQRPNGEIWDAEVQLMLFQHRGKSLMQFTLQDITARKKAEKALKRSEHLYRTIFENTGVANVLLHEDTKIILANSEFEKLSGYSKKEIEEKISWTEFFIGDDLTRMLEYHRLRRMDENAAPRKYECRLRDRYGNIKYIALSVDMIPGTKESIASLHDITERKVTEKTLQESQQRLAEIIEFLPDATFVVDKDGKVIAWNRAMEIMTGVKKENMLGKGDYEYALPFHGERRAALVDYALHPDKKKKTQYKDLQESGSIISAEFFIPNMPHGDIHVFATASVLRDSRGEVIAAIECVRDITERKKMAERLNRAEKMESLGTLAGGVAHDLNNVIGVMTGYSELLIEMMPEGDTPRKYADNILQSSMKCAAIIQDLLTLARRGVNISEIVDLNKVIIGYLGSPEFEKLKSYHPNVKIETELEDGLLNLKGSPIHLGKTIMNLVSNAAEAISDRGAVTVRTENRYLDHPIRGYDTIQEGDYAVLTVSDTGGGISANDFGKIFEPFYTKKVMGRSGTGLGLAVVWGTVKDHKGYIDVQSEEDKGTTFTLYFPATREETGGIKKALSPDYYMSKGESILVVDDVKEQRELAMNMLGRLGYRVAAVSGGKEAIEYLQDKKADLLVLDMIMDPGIDGMETYRRIIEINPGQKAIIVSGFSETDRVKKTQEMGAGAFVRKP